MTIRVVAEGGQAIEAPSVKVNPEIVAHLERLLDRAKAGQIDCIAFVAWGLHQRVDTLSAPVKEFPEP